MDGVLFDCYPVTPGVIIRVASLPLDHFNSLSAEGGDPAMNTQTSKSGFANNLWLQLAALVVVVAVLVAIAAAYVC